MVEAQRFVATMSVGTILSPAVLVQGSTRPGYGFSFRWAPYRSYIRLAITNCRHLVRILAVVRDAGLNTRGGLCCDASGVLERVTV
jgi:hypothetical protein